jgi:hypothetical protein
MSSYRISMIYHLMKSLQYARPTGFEEYFEVETLRTRHGSRDYISCFYCIHRFHVQILRDSESGLDRFSIHIMARHPNDPWT